MAQAAATRAAVAIGRRSATDSAAKLLFFSGIFWLLVAGLVGLLASLQFINPQWSESVSWLTFGRLRPVHVNTALFGWLSMAQVGVAFYMVPRLCGNRLWSDALGIGTALLWNLLVVLAVVTLLAGYNQGREYAEMAWALDVLMVVLLLLSLTNILMTVANRREKKLYVTVWYVLGALVWMPVVYFVGNAMWDTGNLWHLSGAVEGINDATLNWFYGHALLGLWFIPMGLAIAYYFIPVLTRSPLYSNTLALIGFWGLAFLYPLGGQQHLLQTPTPAWLKTVATLATMGLLLPALAVVINLFMTMRGNWQKVYESVALKFIIAGTVLYLVTAVQGSLQAFQGFDRVVHYTQWNVGHVHLALFGGCSLWLMGALYHLVPLMLRRRIWSESLGEAQFWLATGGFLLMLLSLQIGGLIQGAAWQQDTSEVSILFQLKPYFIARGVGGAMMMASGFIMAFNFYKTAIEGEAEDMPTRARGVASEGYTGGR